MIDKSKLKVRVRFAPSPTGFLHVGGLRTALYNYLFAKQNKGVFFLRVEDTDQSRYVPGAVEALLKTIETVGFEIDEGPVLKNGKITEKGKYGPYFQSQRLDIYKKYADELVAKGHAYYCFCLADRLDQLRKTQETNKQPTMYDGLCHNLTPAEIKKKLAAGEKHVIRMNMPKEGQTIFQDLIHGEVKFENKLIDDQVLVKSDGFPTYHLAHAVDDHLMETSHVIRGDEWLSSTPKHLQLFKAFDWSAPAYAHIPLLLNPDRSKLSKRQGDVAVEDYLKKGYLAEALINFIALLGWNPGTEKEIFSLDELIKGFSLAKV
ncbi:MAG: glutamate--tRNA ligase, partial [Patescibacteria group bacterium]